MCPAACSTPRNPAVPSVEALSTMMISAGLALVVRAIDSRQRRVNARLLKTGMTTETKGADDGLAGDESAALTFSREADGEVTLQAGGLAGAGFFAGDFFSLATKFRAMAKRSSASFRATESLWALAMLTARVNTFSAIKPQFFSTNAPPISSIVCSTTASCWVVPAECRISRNMASAAAIWPAGINSLAMATMRRLERTRFSRPELGMFFSGGKSTAPCRRWTRSRSGSGTAVT